MKRRDFIANSAAMGMLLATCESPLNASRESGGGAGASDTSGVRKLVPPTNGSIPVAFAISDSVTIIDFCGPWEVFQDVASDSRASAFNLYTVSENTEPLRGTGGLRLVPDFSFETAPAPKIVVVPAQRGSSALHQWLRKISPKTDVTMSVCTGAFQLAKAGLLSGMSATTHHDFVDQLAKSYPDINVKRGLRFVEGDRISTAGGLTSGIDLALRVVERYFGRLTAQTTADYMEYQSKGWIV